MGTDSTPSQPSSVVQKKSSKLTSSRKSEEKSNGFTTPMRDGPAAEKAPVITANEQELMDELRDRLLQFMKEEEQLKQAREAKGLFGGQDSSTADSTQREKKTPTFQELDLLRRQSAVALREKIPASLDVLLEE